MQGAKSQTSSVTSPTPPNSQPLDGTNGSEAGPSKTRTLILDLGDVLFHYSARELTALSPSSFHAVIISPTWSVFESGRIDEDQALETIGKELSLEPDTIREALEQCRKTLRVDHELYDQLKALKAEMNGALKVYAMTNITKPDFARLKAVLPSWDLFDAEFTSFDAGMTKPELGYYKHVLDNIDLPDPKTAIFVDDKIANVMAARSFGVHGLVFKTPAALIRQLRNRLFDPVIRAQQYMKANARNLVSQIENGPEFRDVFSQFLIHTELQDLSVINLSPPTASETEVQDELAKAGKEAKTWNYFIGPPLGTTSTFPDDVDDTAMALLAFSPPASSANPVLDQILTIRHARDGIVQVYFCEQRPRVCPWVMTNVIRVFYHYNRGADVQRELQYVTRILLSRAYVDGSDHYISADPFLYFLSCLVEANPNAPEVQALRAPLAAACRERVGRRDDAFAVATRVLACQSLGVWAESDISYLKEMQESDGGWEIGWVCCYGRSKKRIGSRGVVTAYAIKALERDAAQA